jgi:hypothetical protein
LHRSGGAELPACNTVCGQRRSAISPLVLAKLYECRDQKRFAQGSRGFIQLGESDPSCPECHAPYALVRPDRRFINASDATPSASGPKA